MLLLIKNIRTVRGCEKGEAMMDGRKFLMLMGLAATLVALPLGVNLAHGGAGPAGVTFYANSPIVQKFVDSLPGLGFANRNNLGQYIPVAIPDTTKFPGSDYYEIGLKDYTQKMHSGLPKATKIRGYYQINTTDPNVGATQYLGPLIIARSYDPTQPPGVAGNGQPVRIKFTNHLGVGATGNLFLPVDRTIMGAGMGPLGATGGYYRQNRATIHLHGGATPWISDGTPHQWITPVGENTTPYLKGVSQRNVPDMPKPAAGSATFYYSNQQSSRLMFYHDHAYGMTRLNVYAGEAAGYLLTDSTEEGLITAKAIPGSTMPAVYRYGIPLIIQDKTFVPNNIAIQDSKWNTAIWGLPGDLWFPHIYEPNQDPTSLTGANDYGRWDYGPWFWPPLGATKLMPGMTAANRHPQDYNTSIVPEAFMDTPVINGTAYPYVNVAPTAYRFRILNACNDRNLNLSLFLDSTGGGTGATATATVAGGKVTGFTVTNVGSGYASPPGVFITGGGGTGAFAQATILGGGVVGYTVTAGGTGYTAAPTITVGSSSEVTMVPALPTLGLPKGWPTDGRDGGAPDPANRGPAFIQIGSEGGLLPAPVVIRPQPVNYDYNRRSIVVLNVLEKGLFMGPAERADVIIDFSLVKPGTNVILYNDAPAPVPGFDPRYDYYTGNPNYTKFGGAPSTKPGFGPNTRTIMQFRVAGTPTAAFNLNRLNTALPAAYVASQPPPIVPQTAYPVPYQAATDTFAKIQDTSLTFTPLGAPAPIKMPLQPKAIQELFDPYGRMNATLGVEMPFTTMLNQTTLPFNYVDPPTEILKSGQNQIWKITHNGVDTHAIHFHLFNVQLINRVGWDGAIRPPDPNELGWKETVRMHPLEDCIVALKPILPTVPASWGTLPNSVRALDPTMPLGSTANFSPFNAQGNPVTVVNKLHDFGHEYVWHCHLLGHEENDMMRALVVRP
jgi:FtsP/CotA-like multicopper oxidase with cupredoxin domain